MGDVHRLVVFDLDGTLIDSRQDLADSANELIADLGGRPLSTSEVAAMVGDGAATLVRRALTAADVPDPGDALARFLSIYDRRLLDHTALYPGITHVLADARAEASLAVLTNKPLAPTERILAALDVRPLFDYVIGGDGPHARKPDPAGLVALMRAASATAASTMLVGDSDVDRRTARAAQVNCCLVTYGFGSLDAAPIESEWIVDDASGMGDVIGEFVRRRRAPGR